MRVYVKKWGNSASVRIPSGVMESASLYLNDEVDVREENGKIIIEPVRKAVYQLEDLLNEITPNNLHSEINFGKSTGKEAW